METDRTSREQFTTDGLRLLESAFEQASEAVLITTAELDLPGPEILFINPAFTRMTGYSAEEVIGRTPRILQGPKTERAVLDELRDSLSRGEAFSGEAINYRKDGSEYHVSWRIAPVRGRDGVVTHFISIQSDVTARKRAENELAEAARLATLGADVGRALTQSESLEEGLGRCAGALVANLGAAFARIWTLNEAGDVLELRASAGTYTRTDGAHSRVPVGQFKIGLIAAERRPHLTNSVVGDPRVHDQEWARREGMVSFAGYPLVVEGRLVGVMALFARRPLTQNCLDVMASVADSIALGIERKRAEEALRQAHAEMEKRVERRTSELVNANALLKAEIAERRRVEEALRASERTLRELVDALPSGVYVCDASGAIESYNRRAAELWGREPSVEDAADVFCGSYKIYTPDGTYLPHEECPTARVLRSGVAVYDEEIVVERPDGSRRTAVVNIIPRRDERGNLTSAINCMTDITERKRAEAELRRSEERYRAILRAIPDLMFLLNEDGVYLDYYAKDKHELAAPPEVFLGKNMREVLPASLCATVSASIRRAREQDEPQIIEFALNVGGEERQYEARIVHSGGDTFLTMVRNITDRKRAEKERSRLLRRLVTTGEGERRRIARELHDQLGRYPTALMLGLKALGDAGGAPPADGDRVQQLMSLADQLGHEIHRLAWELRPSSLDDMELHTSLSNYLEEWSGRLGITADFHSNGLLGRRLPPQVETVVYRIVQEALTNVLKHAEARRVSVVLEYRHERLLAIVEDDGRGFDAEEVLKASSPRRRLGLLGMQERARLVNGELEIESAPGAGTTLYVRIPVPAEHEEEGDAD